MGNFCLTCPNSRKNSRDVTRNAPGKRLEIGSFRSVHSTKTQRPIEVCHRTKKRKLDPESLIPPSLEASSALISERKKTDLDRALILEAFNKHIIFTVLDEESKAIAIDNMKHFHLQAKEYLVKEGFKALYYFIMISGSAEITVNQVRIKLIKPGDGFGESALMHNTPRRVSIKTITESEFWGLDRGNFRHFLEVINAETLQENGKFIESIPIFKDLTAFQREALVSSLSVAKYFPGTEIVTEGALGDWLYIIKEGEVVCSQVGKELRRMRKGEFFGDQALLYGGIRTATVTAVTSVKCVYISAKQLTSALGDCMQNVIFINTIRIAIDKSQFLTRLQGSQKEKLIQSLGIECFYSEDIVVHKNTPLSTGLWIVLKGKVRVGNRVVETFGCFGIETSESLSEDILVTSEIACVASISREEFETCIGVIDTRVNMDGYALLKQVEALQSLSDEKLLSLSSDLKSQNFHDGETIVSSGNSEGKLYIMKSGKVNDSQGDLGGKKPYFGERMFLLEEPSNDTIVAVGEVSCWVLTKDDFATVVSEEMIALLRKRVELYDTSVRLQDLSTVRILGKGRFGLVFLVYHTQKRILYALKSISRARIEAYSLQRNVMLERETLLKTDHQFVTKLIKTFKDSKRVYFLMEYVRGTDFFDVLRILGLVDDKDAQFYAGSLILALEYLHSRSIVYRDLKPENIMIDEDGYIKLIDFGTAKILSGRTYSMVGTPHYMAPELILGKGYGLHVDFWSLGIVIYEMVCGTVPFGEVEDDPYAVYEQILGRHFAFPELMEKRPQTKRIIEQLLSVNPVARTNGLPANLKKHKWLKDLDWEGLEGRKLTPPYIPNADSRKLDLAESFRTKRDVGETAETEENEEGVILSQESDSSTIPAPPPDWDGRF